MKSCAKSVDDLAGITLLSVHVYDKGYSALIQSKTYLCISVITLPSANKNEFQVFSFMYC